jgi:hypothetical protein
MRRRLDSTVAARSVEIDLGDAVENSLIGFLAGTGGDLLILQ